MKFKVLKVLNSLGLNLKARFKSPFMQSIKICEESNTVIAKYPFLKDPVEFLTKRHYGHDNRSRALKVYQGQCRKSEEQKEGMRIVHKDLVEKDFMTRLADMSEEAQKYIKDAGFKHYNPWRKKILYPLLLEWW